MSFADNVLSKMKATPTFRPSNLETFGDWSIEAGDVIQVEVEGRTESVPVFTSNMSWKGSADTTISCSGNEKREMQDKQTRQAYNTAYGFGKPLSQVTEKDMYGNTVLSKEGLMAYVLDKDGHIQEYVISASNVITPDGDEKTLAQILSDLIILNGYVKLLGQLSVKTEGQSVIGIQNSGMLLTAGLQVTGDNGFYVYGKRFEYKEIEYVTSVTQPYVDGNSTGGTACGVTNGNPRYFHPGSYNTAKLTVLYEVKPKQPQALMED